MPEKPADWATRLRAAAREAVSVYLSGLTGDARPLSAAELDKYRGKRWAAGWRLNVVFPDAERRLDVLLTEDFPFDLPRVALVDRPAFLVWPHVESDGLLCILPPDASADVSEPEAVVRHVLGAAVGLVEELSAGGRLEDFLEEFESYWDLTTDRDSPPVYSLVPPGPPSRIVAVWRGQSFFLVADDEETVERWLRNRFGKTKVADFTTDKALWLWMGTPLLPFEYPRTGSDVKALANRDPEAGPLLRQLALSQPGEILVGVGAQTTHGPGLASIFVQPPRRSGDQKPRTRWGCQRRNPVTDGFRDEMPANIVEARTLGGNKALRASLERADAPWVHGRGVNTDFERLSKARVAVLGCGSVGGAVAVALAQAGVGKLLLIDPDALVWANIGRHVLGANEVGMNKAEALADHLTRRFPHLHVDYRRRPWQVAQRDSAVPLDPCDVIVSTMGSWAAEGHLNTWHLDMRRSFPVVYGWTEAHACAGHAVAITVNGGCLGCGFSSAGLPNLRVVEWPSGEPLRQVPACGANFQPYGAAELGFVTALISELAIDCVLGKVATSTQRIWAARKQRLEECGGEWSEDWISLVNGHAAGGIIEERPWPTASKCFACRSAAA